MERLTYTPSEIREAFRYASEQSEFLLRANAANWRRMFTQFVEAMTLRQEALKLLMRILDGHTGLDAKRWFKEAADGTPPPLPEDRYGRLALVWKLIATVMHKPGADFDIKSAVDLPYVFSHAFPGGSLGEKFEAFRTGYLVPFVDALRAWGEAITAKVPDDGGYHDLWDASLAALA